MRPTYVQAAVVGLLCLAAGSARADRGPEVPPAQSRAFALGYTLRSCDLRAISFTQAVKGLKDLDDDRAEAAKIVHPSPEEAKLRKAQDELAGAEVTRLSREASRLRHAQAVAYGQIARLLTRMGSPKDLSDWASGSAATEDTPLVYSREARTLARTEPETAAVLATLDEINALKSDADARQPALAAWLKISGGTIAVWTADVGGYTADLRAGMTLGGHSLLPIGTARRLLQKAPPDSPSAAREELASLIPHGGGNLQDLATLPPASVSPEKMSRIVERLLEIYVPRSAQDRPKADKTNGV